MDELEILQMIAEQYYGFVDALNNVSDKENTTEMIKDMLTNVAEKHQQNSGPVTVRLVFPDPMFTSKVVLGGH